MDPGALAALILLGGIAACILLPVYLRNLLYRRMLDTVAKAIEHGVDPERIAVQLPSMQKEREDDPNGNWKAAVVLGWIAAGFTLAITLPVWLLAPAGDVQQRFSALAPPLLLGCVAIALATIHRRIVGPVVRLNRQQARDNPAPASDTRPGLNPGDARIS